MISFGIALVCITLLPSSNFLLPAGIVLAERTLLLPSFGAMVIVGAAVGVRRRFGAITICKSTSGIDHRHRDRFGLAIVAGMTGALRAPGYGTTTIGCSVRP